MVWGDFSVVWGCFNGPRKDNTSYAYLPNLAENQMGQNYDGFLIKVLNVRRQNEILFALFVLGI